jgi:hypothetical protein
MDDVFESGIVEAELVPDPPSPGNRKRMFRFALIGVGAIAFVALGAYVIVTSMQEDADKVADMVRDHPIVQEQLGGIDACSYNMLASLDEGGRSIDVFDVRGPKGLGQFVTFEFFYKFRSIVLRTEDGEWELLDEADSDENGEDEE